MAPIIDQELVAEIVRLHGTGLADMQIAKVVCCNRSYVGWHLRRRGLMPNHSTNFLTHYNGYFDSIDTWDKAYVLGFIAADGCISQKGLEIGIHKKDVAVLEYIRDQLGSRCKITGMSAGPDYVRIRPSNVLLADALRNLGVTERKSLTLCWPSCITDEFFWPFVLGYFDGDGTIGMYFVSGHNKAVVSFVCSWPFANELQRLLKIRRVTSHLVSYGKFANVRLGSFSQVAAFTKIMYSGARFFLQRKRDIALQIIAYEAKIERTYQHK